MGAQVYEIAAEEFSREVLAGGPVVLDFYSTECPPCEAVAPKYEGVSEQYGEEVRFLRIFRQGNRALADSLGVTSSPTLLFYQGGAERDRRLTGAIKRSEIARMVEQLIPEERARELRSRVRPVSTQCDTLILGGGPAGLTAGIYLTQAHVDTILLDTALPGGNVATTHLVSNYPGFPEPQNGYLLSHFMDEQARKAGVRFRSAAELSSVDLDKKEVLVDGFETIHAKTIIIATGSTPRPLGIPGEKEYRGRGISTCATCDAKYYEGKDVIVIGGGNSALEESLFIARFARTVTIVHHSAALRANKQARALENPRIRFLLEHEPRAFIRHADMDMEVTVENLRNHAAIPLRAHGVFVFVGFLPNVSSFEGRLAACRTFATRFLQVGRYDTLGGWQNTS